ncbi:MAG: DNA-protecting protein DprA [Ruminococcaceae bacterium]|nr:DNA-protecting protein DprA [Oscillospiraceae bacterium]
MLLHWIWFAELKSITLMEKHRLLERFGDPEELYNTADEVLEKLKIVDKNLMPAEQILRRCAQKGIQLLPIKDSSYPYRLRNTPDAPVLLYYKGILPEWEKQPAIGIVGTRKASTYGLQAARQLSCEIAASGGIVVSGGASGIDTAAMQGSVDVGCPVVGVLGCGVDVVYPRSNRKLFEAVVEKGCLISEYAPGEEGIPWHFPARNRIISGISDGVLVVEAPKRSGALITAQRALEQGRDVFVVPGNINADSFVGSNTLLKEGAIPALSGWDVLSCYEFLYPDRVKKNGKMLPANGTEKQDALPEFSEKIETARKKSVDNRVNSTYIELKNSHPALNADEQAVLAQLTRHPQEPAEIIAKLDMPSGKVLSALTMLTVKGLVLKHPGGRVSLK